MLTKKTPERRRSDVLSANFEHISYLFHSVSVVVFEQVIIDFEQVSLMGT